MFDIDINASNALRYYALVLDSEVKEFRQSCFKKTTQHEIAEAEKEYEDFRDIFCGKDISMHNEMDFAAWALANAYEMKGREDGIKAGIGLIVNAMTHTSCTHRNPHEPR